MTQLLRDECDVTLRRHQHRRRERVPTGKERRRHSRLGQSGQRLAAGLAQPSSSVPHHAPQPTYTLLQHGDGHLFLHVFAVYGPLGLRRKVEMWLNHNGSQIGR